MSKLTRTDLLSMLLYGIDKAMRPTIDQPFKDDIYWRGYRSQHRGQLKSMENAGLIETRGGGSGEAWAVRLTGAGHLRAIGGRDAQERWNRAWDGQWNLLMFDLHLAPGRLRQKLFRWLRSNHFGCLQQSVWITPDLVGGELDGILRDLGELADSVLTLRSEIASAHGKHNRPSQIAAQTWDFTRINQGYQDYLDFAGDGPPPQITPARARTWVTTEQRLWLAAVSKDPFLPAVALPEDYLGQSAWRQRERLLENATPLHLALEESPTEAQGQLSR